MRSIAILARLAPLSLGLVSLGHAQDPVPSWTRAADLFGQATVVECSPVTPGYLVAGFVFEDLPTGRLFVSTDAGPTWVQTPNLVGDPIRDVAYSPDGAVYVAHDRGLERSTDELGYFPVNLGFAPLLPRVTAVAVGASPEVWIGLDPEGGTFPALYVSTDGATSWMDRSPPLASLAPCRGLAVDAAQTMRAFAAFGGASGSSSLWFTDDAGTTWTERTTGLPAAPIQALEHVDGRLLVALGDPAVPTIGGLYASSDDGQTWDALSDGSWPTLVANDVVVDAAAPGEILVASGGAGVFRSLDDGATWSFGVGGTGLLDVGAIARSPFDPDLVYLGTRTRAVWYSFDGAGSFTQTSAGLGVINGYDVASNPDDPDELALAISDQNAGGVLTSSNGGVTWSAAPIPNRRYGSVSFEPDGRLYATSSGPLIDLQLICRRDANGWTCFGPTPVFELRGVAASGTQPGVILAIGRRNVGGSIDGRIWRSVDDGATWSEVYAPAGRPTDLLFAADDSDVVLVSWEANSVGGVLRSTDAGLTWGSVAAVPLGSRCPDLARATDGTLYVTNHATNAFQAGGLFRSVDEGLTWTKTGIEQQLFRVAIDPLDPQRLYHTPCGLSPTNTVAVSSDRGKTFAPFQAGLEGLGLPSTTPSLVQTEPALCVTASGRLLYATYLGLFESWSATAAPYCTAKVNSLGCVPRIASDGIPGTSDGAPFVVEASDVLNQKNGLFFYGVSGPVAAPFVGGTLCVAPPLRRTPPASAGGTAPPAVDCSGTYAFDVDAWIAGGQDPVLVPGTELRAQFWTRDPSATFGAGLTDAIVAFVGP